MTDEGPELAVVHYGHAPAEMSEPCADFFDAYWEMAGFFNFVSLLAARADQVQRIARDALAKGLDEEARRHPTEAEMGRAIA